MEIENPYKSSCSEARSRSFLDATRGSRRVRLGVLALSTALLGLFPPTCCPCGFGPIGFIVQPYMLLLGMPAILLPLAVPQLNSGNELVFLSLYVTNYVLMSYGVAILVDRFRQRRATQKKPMQDMRFKEGSP